MSLSNSKSILFLSTCNRLNEVITYPFIICIQIGGIRFLYDNLVESLSRYQVSPGFGCILAHSMGLGKTLQVICFIDVFLRFTKARKVLCIVPMNTIQNWYSEFNTWLPVVSGSKGKDKRTDEESNNGGEEKKGRTFQVLLFSENVKTTVARSALIGISFTIFEQQSQWTGCIMDKILKKVEMEEFITTALKSILKLVKLQSLVAKRCKMWKM